MTQPVESAATEKLYSYVTPLAWADEDQGWALLFLCAALAGMVDDTYDLFQDGDDGRPGWTKVTDPDLCPDAWLEWCAQWHGVELEPALVTPAQKRTKIKEAPGRKRGRPSAIKGAAKPYLDGANPTVFLTERIGGNPYVYAVATLAAETPDQDAVFAALMRAKPGGYVFTYTVITGGDWDTLEATHADWNEVATDFTDWDDLLADPSAT